jgi:uncharacterized membrane protein
MSATPVQIPVDSRWRSLLKAVSWRCVGTIDTFFVSFVVLTFTGATEGNKLHAAQISGSIAGVEVVTKIVLFYLHERAWTRFRPLRHPAAAK